MRHTIHPGMQSKALVTIFMGTIIAGLFLNFGLMRSWWESMDTSSHKLKVHGIERGYELTVPSRPGDKSPVPLIVFLHGFQENAKIARYRTNFDDVVKREGIAIAYPNGLGKDWTAAPAALLHKDLRAEKASGDMDFIEAVVDDVVKQKVADPRRVYLAGASHGGQMVFLMACERPAKFAAMGAIIATMTEPVARHCGKPPPMPMLLMEANDDTLVPWAGVKSTDPFGTYLSVADTVNFWKRIDRCNDLSVPQDFKHLRADDPTRVSVETFAKCAQGTQVSLYTLDKSGHQVPSTSGDDLWNSVLGPRNHDVEAAQELWSFFSQFGR